MKKILSVLLVAAMLVATLVAAVVTVSAADGDWSIYTVKSQYLEGYADVMHSIPGYQYTDEGLTMVTVDENENNIWSDSSPWATFQTTEPVYLPDGVYLQVRVDEFSYDAGDKWFGFSLWDQENVELGKQGDDYGYGVETLIRIKGLTAVKDEEGKEVTDENGNTVYENKDYKEDDKTTWLGAMSNFEWYKDEEEGQRIGCKNPTNDRDSYNYEFDENGCPILTLEVKWDDGNEDCIVYINGVQAPDEYNSALNRVLEANDNELYVGFSLQNNLTGGTAKCTILKYGQSAEDATTPVATGSDYLAPDVRTNKFADLMDPSEIAEGEPAIRLNGVKTESDVKGAPTSVMGNQVVINDDNSVNVLANKDNLANIKFVVSDDVSYAVEDFPIALAITRNFCTCEYKDNDGDGQIDPECICQESLNSLALVGNLKQEAASYAQKSEPLLHSKPFYIGDDYYNFFIFDWALIDGITGRINGIRIDVIGNMQGSDPERNNFDVMEVAFFRNIEEAEDYFYAYYEMLQAEANPDEPVDTDAPTQAPTDAPTQVPTEAPTEAPTQAPTETPTQAPTEAPTQAPTEAPTEAPTKAPEKPTEAPAPNDGCGGVVGVGAIAVVAIAAAGLISFKKKED